jgi:N-dimethylarginine dimethylaminohydrolase
MAEEIGQLWAACGVRAEWTQLRAVMLHRPSSELSASADPDGAQMLEPLDISVAQAEHDGMAAAFRSEGVEVHTMSPVDLPPPNLMFAADLLFMTPEGAIVSRPASRVRAGEEGYMSRALARLGIPIIRTIGGSGTFEGADAMWLSPGHVLIGRGLRTNESGAAQVTSVLSEMGVRTTVVDLPVGTMHLMGMLRIVDRDLALAWPERLAYAAVQALRESGYRVLFFPDLQEAATGHACNFVTLSPGRIFAPAGNPNTLSFLRGEGLACITVPVWELAKAAGSIGCLTGVLHRDDPGSV